jgi:hypothetical protein
MDAILGAWSVVVEDEPLQPIRMLLSAPRTKRFHRLHFDMPASSRWRSAVPRFTRDSSVDKGAYCGVRF